ncbi:1-deoxy-D-xylulose-5-phosphate reductoisomerase [Candidatus Pantoea edessiphila]|uniref:1-deoxy-D-xylulose 5-phosphate reductoisomerase n=1 Tax=Candidatus Pantoea edessiphila TaxID=2044610 RepID=A0A2P5SY06_9GAMM|nr:1-deoxy-D-xylulose-5-phosphate reductoisomerase [Candidatus Pantoea edessiphila]MBK4775565.1 1-deoxy-D-xylulose-5-phosphate reductoisomerase [Pantoea sp. Edef]PPI87218.1 1-deoxy-D-xylulose-5-phosphate reductoisomerase [Candidatus Pantoea edessiphila]
MKRLTLLGSTGSIGINTLDVIRVNPELYQVIALVAGGNIDLMVRQCELFQPRYAAMANEIDAKKVRNKLKSLKVNTEVLSGIKVACELARLSEVDQVMAAIVGISGLLPTWSAIRAGKTVLLANKESLVTCGRIFMEAVKKHNAKLLPVDSEHNAIFQILPFSVQNQLGYADLRKNGVESIILTGSGGPFLNIDLKNLNKISPNEACAHPNWSMGRKISVDSATMMNKGLEYVEARWLFNANANQIELILHPQSIIHSMVRYCDGSVLAQLGNPDMRIPIANTMAWPARITTSVPRLDFTNLSAFTFIEPDFNRYPCLKLMLDAFKDGQAATTILNAANEIAVEAFLNHKIKFTDIASLNSAVLTAFSCQEPATLEAVLEIDRIARDVTEKMLVLFD